MKTCLVVDDSKVIRQVARKILEGLNFKTEEAENGEEALAACQKAMPDAVLLDWHMPVKDGMEFLRDLRSMENVNQPSVVVCSTETNIERIQEALAAGADEYIMKPFDSEIISCKLSQVGLI